MSNFYSLLDCGITRDRNNFCRMKSEVFRDSISMKSLKRFILSTLKREGGPFLKIALFFLFLCIGIVLFDTIARRSAPTNEELAVCIDHFMQTMAEKDVN